MGENSPRVEDPSTFFKTQRKNWAGAYFTLQFSRWGFHEWIQVVMWTLQKRPWTASFHLEPLVISKPVNSSSHLYPGAASKETINSSRFRPSVPRRSGENIQAMEFWRLIIMTKVVTTWTGSWTKSIHCSICNSRIVFVISLCGRKRLPVKGWNTIGREAAQCRERPKGSVPVLTRTLRVRTFPVSVHIAQEEIIVMGKSLTLLTCKMAFKKYMQHGWNANWKWRSISGRWTGCMNRHGAARAALICSLWSVWESANAVTCEGSHRERD